VLFVVTGARFAAHHEEAHVGHEKDHVGHEEAHVGHEEAHVGLGRAGPPIHVAATDRGASVQHPGLK
jgi:hypothetical protein